MMSSSFDDLARADGTAMFKVKNILHRADALLLWFALAIALEIIVTFVIAIQQPEWFLQIALFMLLQLAFLPSTLCGCVGAMFSCCFLHITYRARFAALSGLLFFPAMYECAVLLGGTQPGAVKDFYAGPVFDSAATTLGVPFLLGALLFGALGFDARRSPTPRA